MTKAYFSESVRVSRERQQLERDLADINLRRNATPQTLRHRQVSIPDELFNRDKLTIEQLRAANEIHDVLSSIARGLSIKTSCLEPRIRGSYTEDWRPGLSRAYQERYIPWRDAAGKMPLRHSATVADLVLDVVIDNKGMSQVATMWGMDARRVLSIFRDSLYAYCVIAQWVSPYAQGRLEVANAK